MSGADWSKIQYVWNTLRVTAGKCYQMHGICLSKADTSHQ
jgi:hypothetical protein